MEKQDDYLTLSRHSEKKAMNPFLVFAAGVVVGYLLTRVLGLL